MNTEWMTRAIWGAGAVHVGIIAANVPFSGRLRVREQLAGVPRFFRQIFYVRWLYIVIVLGMFAALCFGFAPELAGATAMGRFLSAFMAAFWLLRIGLQVFYYDPEIRCQNRALDASYMVALVALVVVFGTAALRPL
jgi:hypothetical protein